METTSKPKSVLTKDEFIALRKDDLFRDVNGQLWTVIEADDQKVVEGEGGEQISISWSDEKALIVDEVGEELLEFQTWE